MDATPLYDALAARAARQTARFHMPGHKGRGVTPALDAMAALDFTELPDTGDLYAGGDVIAQAEDLWARAWGFGRCQFLTGGSTQGLQAALLLAARRGKGVLVDRCSHRSVYNALGLLDLTPTYLLRAQDRPIDPQALDRALTRGKNIKTVCITSPTYYGVLSDAAALAHVAHRHGAWLVVDGAHGAHLPFLGENPFAGADLVVTSAHKTLPVWGQGALLFSAGTVEGEDLGRAAAVWGTSSPSYPVMASLDCARAWMEGPGREGYARAAAFCGQCRGEFSALDGPGLDPTRLVLMTNPPGLGLQAAAELEGLGVAPEMADAHRVVFILTGADSPEDHERLWEALRQTGRFAPGVLCPALPLPPEPEVVCSPAAALLGRRSRRPLEGCQGLVAAGQVAPYPPGVPVIAPGERITKKCLAYLAQVGYNVGQDVDILVEREPEEGQEP